MKPTPYGSLITTSLVKMKDLQGSTCIIDIADVQAIYINMADETVIEFKSNDNIIKVSHSPTYIWDNIINPPIIKLSDKPLDTTFEDKPTYNINIDDDPDKEKWDSIKECCAICRYASSIKPYETFKQWFDSFMCPGKKNCLGSLSTPKCKWMNRF